MCSWSEAASVMLTILLIRSTVAAGPMPPIIPIVFSIVFSSFYAGYDLFFMSIASGSTPFLRAALLLKYSSATGPNRA